MSKKETVTFKDVATTDWKTIGNLSDIKGETISLVSYELVQDAKQEIALVDIEREDGTKEKRHTFSMVLIKQLKQIEGILRTKKVTATVTKHKNYYVFE